MGVAKKIRKLLRRPEPFQARHFARQEALEDDYKLVAASLLRLLDFDTVYDVGCANGLLLREFHRRDKRVRGIELSPEIKPFLPEEIRDKVEIGDFAEAHGEAELACCVEIAEHIQPARTDQLVDKLASIATKWIYFTAAPPGQPGLGHINCRPMDDWIDRFRQRDWHLDERRTGRLRRQLAGLDRATWLEGNSVIFRRIALRATR